MTERLTRPGHPGDGRRPPLGHEAEQPYPQLRALEQQEQHQNEDGDERDEQREGALAEGEGRLAEALAEARDLRGVVLHPGLDVIPAHQVADPALAALGLVDVRGQPVGEMGDPVDERVTERDGQAGEDQHGPDGDDGDGEATASHLPVLKGHHERVQEQGDEACDRDEQEYVTQPVEQLPCQVDPDHHGHRGQDRAQRDAPRLRCAPQPGPPGVRGWQIVRHRSSMAGSSRSWGRRRRWGATSCPPTSWPNGPAPGETGVWPNGYCTSTSTSSSRLSRCCAILSCAGGPWSSGATAIRPSAPWSAPPPTKPAPTGCGPACRCAPRCGAARTPCSCRLTTRRTTQRPPR